MPTTLERLAAESETIRTDMTALLALAEDQGRDLDDDETLRVRAWRDRLEAIDGQAETVSAALDTSAQVRDRLARIPTATTAQPAPIRYRTAGYLLHDLISGSRGDRDAGDRITRYLRAAEHMGTDAATTVATAGDLGGLRVDPVVGPIINPRPADMPFLSAIGMRPASSISFMRPYVDTAFGTGAGPQGEGGADEGKEKAELPSKSFTIEADTVTLQTVGEYLNVSIQLTEFQPGALDIIIDHLTRATAYAMEVAAVTELGQSTGKTTLAADADAATILAALWDASAAVWAATGMPGSWVLMGPLGAARLGSLVDAAGRPLFPYLGASNALGTGNAAQLTVSPVAGLTPIVSHAITDTTFWVGNGYALEAWVRWFPVLEAIEPSVLGRQVARAAAFKAVRPTATANSAQHLAP